MPTIQKMHHCVKCERRTIHIQQKPNHVLHLLLTLVTAGLWILVWVAMSSSRPQCTQCGHDRRTFDAMVGMAEDHKPGSTKPGDDLDESVMYQLGSLFRKGKRQ